MKVTLKKKEEEKNCYESLPKHHTKSDISRRGIQIDPTELGPLSQNIDPPHSPPPLSIGIGRSVTSLLLGPDGGRVIVPIPLEVSHLPSPNPFEEIRMKFPEELIDSRDPLKLDGTCQGGVIERDVERRNQCAFDDQRMSLFTGNGNALAVHGGDAGDAWVL